MAPSSTTCRSLFTVHCSLFTVHYLLLTTYCLLPTTYYLLPTTYQGQWRRRQLRAVHCSLFTVHCSLFTTYYLLLTAYYLLPTTYYLLLTKANGAVVNYVPFQGGHELGGEAYRVAASSPGLQPLVGVAAS